MTSEIEEFFGGYDDAIATLSKNLSKLVSSCAPQSSETLQKGWKMVSFGHREKFCSIAPHSKWVNLHFQAGSSLEDSEGLLEGSGKSMRHVKITKAADLSKDLKALVKQAAQLAQ